MGTDGGPAIVTVRYEGYLAALQIHDYPRETWAFLCSGAALLHRLVRGLETIVWGDEIPRLRGQINGFAKVRPSDVT